MDRTEFWLRASGIAVMVAVLGIWLWLEAAPTPREAPPAGQAITLDRTPDAMQARKRVIDELSDKGLVRRIEQDRGGTVRMTLRQTFYVLEQDAQRKYVEAVYAYYFDGSNVNDAVILRDARHGNEVGSYNPYRGGLHLYK